MAEFCIHSDFKPRGDQPKAICELYEGLNQGDNHQALKIFKELMDNKEGKGQLWKKLAAENYRSISRKLSYDDYLKD